MTTSAHNSAAIRVPLARPFVDHAEQAAIAQVLESGHYVQGERVRAFEQSVAERVGHVHAVAMSNGTAALHCALLALGVGPGDEVICPDLSWPSPAHAIMLSGARPILIDVDLKTWNASYKAYSGALSGKTKAVIIIDQFGNPAEVEELKNRLKGIPIIEDAACAIGSTMANTAVGRHATIACYSFHPRKVVTTGEGGMCLTSDGALYERLLALRNHGQRTPGHFVIAATNYRMTEIAAAMGSVQMGKLSAMLDKRNSLAKRYRQALPHLRWQEVSSNAVSNYQTMGLLLIKNRQSLLSSLRADLIARMRHDGIEIGRLSYAIHRLPSVRVALGEPVQDFRYPNATLLDDAGISLPLYPTLSEQDQDLVIATLTRHLKELELYDSGA